MPLYFAYGANMDCCRDGVALSGVAAGRAAGGWHRHRFIVMREGYASVVRDGRHTVWGVLWELALADVPALDRYEGVAGGLYVKASQPVATAGGVKRALIYLGRSTAYGVPKPGYLDAVLAAGEAAQLPVAYLRELRGWRRGSPA